MRSTWGIAALAILLWGTAAAPRSAAAQIDLSVAAGAANYDLSGTGLSGVAAARLDYARWRVVRPQVGTGYFWYRTGGEDEVALLLPEVGARAQMPGRVPLYLGAGVGYAVGVKGNPTDHATLYGALGMELEDRAGWAIRPELRVRSVDPWAGTIADFTVGIRRRFGA